MDLVGDIISCSLPIPHLFSNAAVIYLSIFHVKQSILRTYALNLTIPSLGYSLYSIVLVVLKLLGRGRQFGIRKDSSTASVSDYFGDVIAYLCGYDYRMLAIVLVGVTYISFAAPVFAKQHLTEKTVYFWFALAHILAIMCSTVSTLSSKQSQEIFINGRYVDVNWTDYVEGTAEIGTFIAFILLYIVCIREIVKFNHQQKVTRDIRRDKKQLKKQLLAILAYITPPTVFLIPYSLCTDITTAYIPASALIYNQICHAKVHFYGSLIAIRYFVASFTILVAFGDYRRAVFVTLLKRVPASVSIRPHRSTGGQSSSYM